MKLRVTAVVFLSAVSLFGQAATSLIDLQAVTKVVTLKYPERVSTNILEGIGLVVKRSENIVAITGPRDRVETAEAILHQLDVPATPRAPLPPRKNIQFTAYLIIASPSGAQAAPLPKELEAAVNQVASVMPYKSFHLFDAVIMRGSDGAGGYVSGVLPAGPQTFVSGGAFTFRVGRVELTPGTPANSLHLTNLDVSVSINHGIDREGKDKVQMVNLATSIDMKEGQKVVVGKANIDGSENALLVILTAQGVD